jgi:hypothetical protein
MQQQVTALHFTACNSTACTSTVQHCTVQHVTACTAQQQRKLACQQDLHVWLTKLKTTTPACATSGLYMCCVVPVACLAQLLPVAVRRSVTGGCTALAAAQAHLFSYCEVLVLDGFAFRLIFSKLAANLLNLQ